MDEVLLNDLLECSVCLERLDTSSRVLPCQHTFCLKCLKVIVESRKELRCPECRILVETNVEELPPNVLLMRILEGMRNSAPRKLPGPTQRATRGGTLVTQQGLQSSARAESKQLPPHARAMYDYITKEASDLSFKKGETILLLKKLDPFWYQGECSGRTGMFPITYVQVVVPLPIPAALCKALYDFRMSAPDEEGCLAFDKGSIITVHRRVDENWAEGRLDHRVGIFPIAFVELNQSARQLMNSTPLNRPVPALPDLSRAGHSEHRSHTQHPHRYQQMSISTPVSVQGNYQNMASMSQSHPNYQTQQMLVPTSQILVPQTINHAMTTISSHGGLVTRNIMEPTQQKNSLNDLIHFTNIQNKSSHQGTVAIQSVSRIGENFRPVKYDSYNSTPVHKTETTYQNVRTTHDVTANFNANSSDSSSSVNTQSNQTNSSNTPNTSSDTSTCESNEPSLPSSPDNNTERNQTVITVAQNQEESNENDTTLNTSMGVLSLNESSTATNTSLNVSLPPSDSPKLNQSSGTSQSENQEGTSSDLRLDTPSSSKSVRSGPESLLNFGLGLQAVLSPSHGKDNYMVSRAHRDHHHREREKRHSLTQSSHLQGNHSTQNRHSAEILATSLLDHTPERDRDSVRSERERERRRRRSRSNERPLPSAYVALYPYKPQKPDELELKKGGIYTVTERCRDGWYKGCSERSGRCGVFPGNYVAPHPAHTPHPAHPIRHKHDKSSGGSTSASGTSVASGVPAPSGTLAPPDAPPRAQSPLAQHTVQPLTYPWSTQVQPQPQNTPKADKLRDKPKSEKSSSGGVGLMRRLAAIKRSKSPPLGHCIDNPVFEDSPGPSPRHPVHVRTSNEGPWQTQHRKSQSLDVTATRRDRHHSQTVKERFRCIVPYPPNSEYELELKVDDIVIVSKKRGDGWYKGTLQRTGRTGLFPASFVQSCPQE